MPLTKAEKLFAITMEIKMLEDSLYPKQPRPLKEIKNPYLKGVPTSSSLLKKKLDKPS